MQIVLIEISFFYISSNGQHPDLMLFENSFVANVSTVYCTSNCISVCTYKLISNCKYNCTSCLNQGSSHRVKVSSQSVFLTKTYILIFLFDIPALFDNFSWKILPTRVSWCLLWLTRGKTDQLEGIWKKIGLKMSLS